MHGIHAREPAAAPAGNPGPARTRLRPEMDGGRPAFLTTPGELVNAVRGAIHAETGLDTELSTTGGTSDGRFIAKVCPQVIEFGPLNATIHKINECVDVSSLDPLKNIYKGVLERLAGVSGIASAPGLAAVADLTSSP
ncbi:M20/M25/M40 family metallo-hydrolase [Polaromonas sp. P1(28)-8]|nr:M20/M25/M40 family metallo-hydrolase [Polaromonas sp. P1(28)-8]